MKSTFALVAITVLIVGLSFRPSLAQSHDAEDATSQDAEITTELPEEDDEALDMTGSEDLAIQPEDGIGAPEQEDLDDGEVIEEGVVDLEALDEESTNAGEEEDIEGDSSPQE